MTNEIYKKLKEECKKMGCRCPPSHIVAFEYANTMPWLRIYCRLKENG